MTKLPIAGQVNTRLIPALGAQGAAVLHEALLSATLDRVGDAGLPCTVAIAGDMAHPLVGQLQARGLSVEPQAEGDLGNRLRHALRGPERAIALGADCVCFSPEWLVQAAQATAPVSLGPTKDGGYWIIAVEGNVARQTVFVDIPWSTDQTHAVTIARAEAAGLAVHSLPACYDIDRPEDLEQLLRDERCPEDLRTRVLELGA